MSGVCSLLNGALRLICNIFPGPTGLPFWSVSMPVWSSRIQESEISEYMSSPR